MENYFIKNIKNVKNIKCESLSPRKRSHDTYTSKSNLDYIIRRYDQKMIILQNKLFSLIIKFHSIFKKLITDINSVLITLGNQAICSKSLLLNLNFNDEKISHLNDRLEMINDTKNLLDNNLLIANNNLNMFISEVQKNFNEFKELKQEKENDMNNFYYKNRIKRINKALNYNSNPTEKRETNYLLLNSNPNESNKKIQIENSVNYMTTNNKNDILIDNYIITPKHNYFKSINHNNTYLNLKRKEKKSNNIHQFCQSPDINNYSKKNVSPKKTYYNKSQEIIKDDITSRQKLNTKTKRNYYSILDTKRDDNDNKIKYSNSNNTQRKNKILNDKIFNMSNINKKLKNNFFVNWTKNFKKVNYRDKILYKQNEQEYT